MTDLSRYRERIATEIMGWEPDSDSLQRKAFRPDEDVAQAIQVLEVFSKQANFTAHLELGLMWRCVLNGGMRLFEEYMAPKLPTAIITAVVRAKGWDE